MRPSRCVCLVLPRPSPSRPTVVRVPSLLRRRRWGKQRRLLLHRLLTYPRRPSPRVRPRRCVCLVLSRPSPSRPICRPGAFFAAQALVQPPDVFLKELEQGNISLPLAPPKGLPSFVDLVAKYGTRIAITHEAAMVYDNVLGKVRCPGCCCPPATCLRACPCTRCCPVRRSLLRAPARS